MTKDAMHEPLNIIMRYKAERTTIEEAAAEIDAYAAAERTKRLQAEHERDVAIEQLAARMAMIDTPVSEGSQPMTKPIDLLRELRPLLATRAGCDCTQCELIGRIDEALRLADEPEAECGIKGCTLPSGHAGFCNCLGNEPTRNPLREALERIVALHDRVDLVEAQEIASNALSRQEHAMQALADQAQALDMGYGESKPTPPHTPQDIVDSMSAEEQEALWRALNRRADPPPPPPPPAPPPMRRIKEGVRILGPDDK